MSALGIDDEAIQTPEPIVRSFGAEAAQEKKCRKGMAAPVDEQSDGFAVVEALPSRYYTLGALSNAMLRDKVLPAIEPVALSAANLRASEKLLGGKEGLLHIIEFATGLCGDLGLIGRLRCLRELLALCTERNLLRGRRCIEMPVPPQWAQHGLFGIVGGIGEEVAGRVTIVHKFTHEKVHVDVSLMPPHDLGTDLYIEFNWSEQRAAVASVKNASGDSRYSLCNVFAGHVKSELPIDSFTTPPAKGIKRQPSWSPGSVGGSSGSACRTKSPGDASAELAGPVKAESLHEEPGGCADDEEVDTDDMVKAFGQALGLPEEPAASQPESACSKVEFDEYAFEPPAPLEPKPE